MLVAILPLIALAQTQYNGINPRDIMIDNIGLSPDGLLSGVTPRRPNGPGGACGKHALQRENLCSG
jgi:hypothetical protein